MAVAQRLGLLDELDLWKVPTNSGAEGFRLTGRDDEGGVADACGENFIKQKLDGGFWSRRWR